MGALLPTCPLPTKVRGMYGGITLHLSKEDTMCWKDKQDRANNPQLVCPNGDKAVQGKAAVAELTEIRYSRLACTEYREYVEKQVGSFKRWLDEQGKDGKSIVFNIRKGHLKKMEEDVFEEFIWTPSRETRDTSLVDIGSENHATKVELTRDLVETRVFYDDQRKAWDYPEVRHEDEHKCHHDYWGMLHRIAYQAFMKTLNEDSPYSVKLFNSGLKILDKVEQRYDPDKAPVAGLSWSDYNMLTGKNNPNAFRKKLNFHRFTLYTLSHEQWAYLMNYLNVLTNWMDLESGEVKQYPCESQNIMVGEKWVNPEDVQLEITEVFYTRS